MTFSEAGRGDRLKAWVDKFNKSQSAIEVQPVALPFSSFAKTIFTQMGGGEGPDLVRFDQIDYYAAVAANRILQLDEAINDRDYKFTAPDKYLKVGGKRFGTPFEISNYVLLYNPTLLKDSKAPANFDEFIATAKAATANGVYGYAYRATMAEGPGFWQDLCNYVYGFGGRWSDEQGNLTHQQSEGDRRCDGLQEDVRRGRDPRRALMLLRIAACSGRASSRWKSTTAASPESSTSRHPTCRLPRRRRRSQRERKDLCSRRSP